MTETKRRYEMTTREKIKPLNEAAIKSALYDGLITAKEARHMLMVYLKKSNFSPLEQSSTKVHQVA